MTERIQHPFADPFWLAENRLLQRQLHTKIWDPDEGPDPLLARVVGVRTVDNRYRIPPKPRTVYDVISDDGERLVIYPELHLEKTLARYGVQPGDVVAIERGSWRSGPGRGHYPWRVEAIPASEFEEVPA